MQCLLTNLTETNEMFPTGSQGRRIFSSSYISKEDSEMAGFGAWMAQVGITYDRDLVRLAYGSTPGTGGGVFAVAPIQEGDVLCW